MLVRLSLENIAIIEAIELEFQAGLNVITGETGSGKSLILDAIQRVFDKRTSPKDLLKHGTTRGRIELTFDLSRIYNRKLVGALLAEAGVELIPGETDLVLSRDIMPSGSRCRVNGYAVPLEVMEKLGMLILEIYGQHDLHVLFSSARQRDLMDNLGGDPLLKVRAEVRQTYREFQKLKAELETLRQQQHDRDRQLDFLSFQVQEIVQAEIAGVDEDERLKQERDRLSHVEHLRKASLQALHLLTADDDFEAPSVMKQLGQVQKTFNHGLSMDAAFEPWCEQLATVSETLRNLVHELCHYTETLDMRPERMTEIVDRLDLLEKMKRKYGGSLEAVLKTAAELEAQLDRLQQAETHISDLEKQVQAVEARHYQLCLTLTDLRKRVADALESSVIKELQEMLLPAAQFEVLFQPVPPSELGQEQTLFMFSANPGEPLKPLSQVASGGELSRLMLSLKIQTAHVDQLSTLILDEIDTGLSGMTVRTLAEKLQTLQQHCQLIVVTHQPIVAAKAPWHLHVQKHLKADGVDVSVVPLVKMEHRKAVLSQLASGLSTDNKVTAQFVEQLLS